ncbi:bifunctional adenosylcobinamide kinase/adenosylcobinamide-phosphate guanylyltransferase [Limnoglobus roseus]|uniref:Adenosylcobinamide kinase n=1 Tax=Limnoglobus roseus TaxID=2598579 RepID=A0A5C1AJA3_9BACT|nr:bifunctional adenosylcobinamide kinase/adenosylcobinamide-phosphate guanylyltransferase [Limnoglobus roseus]QEL18247.1 bifunctional adenosylcobinamide kinase/adenosylcobinamide-phosphate guanylyltransferase [Limnoglobus roseus]
MGRLILVTGGARSGKSDFAERLARQLGGEDVVFIATAEARDDEMARRIAAHRQSRPATWQTLEAARDVGRAVVRAGEAATVLIDCLTLLVSNLLLADGEDTPPERSEAAVEAEVAALLDAVRASPATVIVVTNEVGLGIVPVNRLARQYRDLLGRANAVLAKAADEVYLLISGLPVEIKSLALRGNFP